MGLLEDARAEIEDGEYDVNKLSLAQLLQSRNLHIQQQRLEIDQQQQQIRQKDNTLREQNDVKNAQIQSLQEQNESLQSENAALKQSHKVCVSYVCLLRNSVQLLSRLFTDHTYCGHTHNSHPKTNHIRSQTSLSSKTTYVFLLH